MWRDFWWSRQARYLLVLSTFLFVNEDEIFISDNEDDIVVDVSIEGLEIHLSSALWSESYSFSHWLWDMFWMVTQFEYNLSQANKTNSTYFESNFIWKQPLSSMEDGKETRKENKEILLLLTAIMPCTTRPHKNIHDLLPDSIHFIKNGIATVPNTIHRKYSVHYFFHLSSIVIYDGLCNNSCEWYRQ
jgi:hypothetical protein